MKRPWFLSLVICTSVLATLAGSSAQPALSTIPEAVGPRLTFATNEYNFGRVTAGTLVKYDFIVTNTGDESLDIFAVAPGCHCPTAGDWTHHVAPGQTGQIPIQFDSSNFRSDVTKTIMVTSNDKHAPRQNIFLHGTVWRQFEVSPPVAYITIPPGATSNSTCTVHITNLAPAPLELSTPVSISSAFKAELRVIEPGEKFEVLITAVPPLATGNTVGKITLKTSLTNLPELSITTFATMQPVFAVVPPQLILPSQTTVWTTNLITINSHQNTPLDLSDPQISFDPQASVQLKTLVPGRRFQLVVAIPPGNHSAASQAAQVTVKSNNSAEPVIAVPIRIFSTQHAPPPLVKPRLPPAPAAANHP